MDRSRNQKDHSSLDEASQSVHDEVIVSMNTGMIRRQKQHLTLVEIEDIEARKLAQDPLFQILQRQKKTNTNARQILEFFRTKPFFQEMLRRIDAEEEHDAAIMLLKNVKYEKYKAGQVIYYKEDKTFNKMYYVYKGTLAYGKEQEETGMTQRFSSEPKYVEEHNSAKGHHHYNQSQHKAIQNITDSAKKNTKLDEKSQSKSQGKNGKNKIDKHKESAIHSKQDGKQHKVHNLQHVKLGQIQGKGHNHENEGHGGDINPQFLLQKNEIDSEKKIVWVPDIPITEESFIADEFFTEAPWREHTLMAVTDCHLVVFLTGTFEFVKTRYNRNSARMIDLICRFFPSKESQEETFITRILKTLTLKELIYGNFVTVENMNGSEFYMILDGNCELQKNPDKNDPQSKTTSICLLEPGTLIGDEVLFLDETKYIFSSKVTSGNITIIVFDKEKFLSLFPKRIINHMREAFDNKLLANIQMYNFAMANSAAYQRNNLTRFADAYFKSRQRQLDGEDDKEEEIDWDDPVKFLNRLKKKPDPMQKYYRYTNRNFHQIEEEKKYKLTQLELKEESSSTVNVPSKLFSIGRSSLVRDQSDLEKGLKSDKELKYASAPASPIRDLSPRSDEKDEVLEDSEIQLPKVDVSNKKQDIELENEFREYFRKIIIMQKREIQKGAAITPKLRKSLLPGFPDRVNKPPKEYVQADLVRSSGIKKGIDINEFENGTNTVARIGNFKTSESKKTYNQFLNNPENFRLIPAKYDLAEKKEDKTNQIFPSPKKKKWVTKVDVIKRIGPTKYISNKFLQESGVILLRSSTMQNIKPKYNRSESLQALKDVRPIQQEFQNGEITMREYLNSYRKAKEYRLNSHRGEALLFEQTGIRRSSSVMSGTYASSPLKSSGREKLSPMTSFNVNSSPMLPRSLQNTKIDFYIT